jgi:hypothetical protein
MNRHKKDIIFTIIVIIIVGCFYALAFYETDTEKKQKWDFDSGDMKAQAKYLAKQDLAREEQ